jgi:hypothetical protein
LDSFLSRIGNGVARGFVVRYVSNENMEHRSGKPFITNAFQLHAKLLICNVHAGFDRGQRTRGRANEDARSGAIGQRGQRMLGRRLTRNNGLSVKNFKLEKLQNVKLEKTGELHYEK